MSENQKTTYEGDKGIACPFLPPYQANNPVTGRVQLHFMDCLGTGCNLYVDGDCSLKGMFHKNYKPVYEVKV